MYQIRNGHFLAEINPHGAELKSFRDEAKGIEYIWQADPACWDESAPWLFPVVCDLRDGQTMIEGKRYVLGRHGFAKDQCFQVREHTQDCIELCLEDSEQTKRQYPYAFRLTIRYQMHPGRLSISASVENLNTRKMFYCLGFHPGFNCPIFPGEWFEDYRVVLEKPEQLDCPTLDPVSRLIDPSRVNYRLQGNAIELNHELFQNDVLILDSLRSRKASLLSAATGHGIEIAFPDYAMLGIWTKNDALASYVCLEPWNGASTYVDEDDELKHKRLCQSLEPGRRQDYSIVLSAV